MKAKGGMESLHGVIRDPHLQGQGGIWGLGGDDDQQEEARVDETGNHLGEGWAGGCGKLMAGIYPPAMKTRILTVCQGTKSMREIHVVPDLHA